MKATMTKRSIRYTMENIIYENHGVLDSIDMDNLLSNNENYKGLFNSFQWFNTETYIKKINELLNMFDSSFSLIEFDWNDSTGGLWVFKHH